MATRASSSILRMLRQSLASRHISACSDCLIKSRLIPSKPHVQRLSTSSRNQEYKSVKNTPFLAAFKSVRQRHSSTLVKETPAPASLSRASATPQAAQKVSSFPQTSQRVVGWWLFGSAASVFGIVVFGGLTRLTESGLSITEWRPITGTLPPMSFYSWELEYEKYKASPEFQLLNPNMTLSEFKKIYYMEYTHRLWGRVIGLTFFVPTVYFILRRRVSAPLARNLLLINGLIGLQGFVGWWMVKSGLKDDLFAKGSHPRVSQYRLLTHLGLAFTVYGAMLWNGIQVFRERHLVVHTAPDRARHLLTRLSSTTLRPIRLSTILLGGLVSITALSGALVAGLDAGLIYNEFPYMGLGLTPPSSELWSSFYSRREDGSDIWWRNMLENPSLVQLDHRILACSTFVAVHALFAYARFSPAIRGSLTKGAKMAFSGALGLVWVQVTLGLTTLLYLVPTPLAAAHQAGSLALLTSIILLGSRVCTPPRLRRLVSQRYAEWASKATRSTRLPSSKFVNASSPAPASKLDTTGAAVTGNSATTI